MKSTTLADTPSWTTIEGIPYDGNAQSFTKIHTYRHGGFVAQRDLGRI